MDPVCVLFLLVVSITTFTTWVQWSEDVTKADPFFRRPRVRFRVPSWVSNTIARGGHVQGAGIRGTTSLSTGGGPVTCVQLPEGGF